MIVLNLNGIDLLGQFLLFTYNGSYDDFNNKLRIDIIFQFMILLASAKMIKNYIIMEIFKYENV